LHDLPQNPSSLKIYEKLHEELVKQKFSKQVEGMNGKRYELPDAVYYSETLENPQQFNAGDVRTLADIAIFETIKFVKKSSPLTTMRGSILVIEAAQAVEIYWQGLTIV
jgi:hypothetical protein